MTQLVRYEQARTALAACHSVDEVKDIRDKADAMAAYARQAKDQDLIQWATEIKVRAERKAGEMLSSMDKHRGTLLNGSEKGAGRGESFRQSQESDGRKLADLGISRNQSSRWQSLASMTDEHFETAVATAKDTAGQVTSAFMLREAGRSRPNKRVTQADASRIDQLNQIKGRSVLIGYTRMVLKGLRERETLSDEERSALGVLKTEIERALAQS